MALDNWVKNWSASTGATGEDVASQYHDDAVSIDVNVGRRSVGREGIVARSAGFLQAAPDGVVTVRSWTESGSTVVAEWTWAGTHTGDMEGWPPSGKSFTLDGCNVMDLDGGLIRNERSYWDFESLKNQA